MKEVLLDPVRGGALRWDIAYREAESVVGNILGQLFLHPGGRSPKVLLCEEFQRATLTSCFGFIDQCVASSSEVTKSKNLCLKIKLIGSLCFSSLLTGIGLFYSYAIQARQ